MDPSEEGTTLDLDALRERIDAVDASMLELLAERAEVVAAIAETKQARGRSTVDPERENALLERAVARGAGRFPREAILAVFREIMSASVSLQSQVTVAFLGPAGTFSHLAARTLFGYAPAYLEAATIVGVFDAVRAGRASFGVVPFENSSEGPVADATEALLATGLKIRREVVVPIAHCLMSQAEALPALERVYSHPQALAQCRDWLHRNVPGAQLVQTPSTAAAVQQARRDAGGAAIGSALAGELHGLPVLAPRVQDQEVNETRFVMIGAEDAPPTGDDRTTLAFAIADEGERGALRRALTLIEDAGVSMTRIESRPRRGDAWRYVFVVDLEGHRADPPVSAAVDALSRRCQRLQILGSYPRYPR